MRWGGKRGLKVKSKRVRKEWWKIIFFSLSLCECPMLLFGSLISLLIEESVEMSSRAIETFLNFLVVEFMDG